MPVKRSIAAAALTFLAAMAALGLDAQTTSPASKPLALEALTVDKAKGQVIMDGVFCLEQGQLEFLVAGPNKEYESLVSTQVKPSSLHAALLMLGLSQGKPARWTSTAPGQPAVFQPPRGAQLEISLRWTGPDGQKHDVPATDLLETAPDGKPVGAVRWVFVGSDVLEGGAYWADALGHHVSVSNFASSVLDVPFESTDKDALLQFAVNKNKVPPKLTPVQVVLTMVQGAQSAPVARLNLAIDQFGRMELEGQPVWPEDLSGLVKKFLARHAQGTADVRVDLRALEYDRQRLSALLQEAGMTDITFRPRQLPVIILPRSPAEAARALEQWKEQFANARDMIGDPGLDAQAVLETIQQTARQAQEQAKMLEEYRGKLSRMLEEYKRQQNQEKK
jgi:truncated hemoglobin YjbI